jgi:peptidyl-prolyl cis-trans isomerase C/peptidyl-prolyl cis-trans isomerase D
MNLIKKIRILSLFFAITSSFVLSLNAQAQTELARVNQTVITLGDFNQKYQDNLKFFPLKPPTKKQVLDDLIKRELGIQEAKRQRLDKNPDVIERINTVLFNSLIEKSLSGDVEKLNISENQAKEYYKKSPIIRTSHILVMLAPTASKEEEKQALDRISKIKEALKGDKSFAEVAQTLSDGPAAAMGGDIDYQSRDRLDPTYYDAALELKNPGAISDVVRSQFGYHIIKLTGIRSWDEVDKLQIKRLAFEVQKNKLFDNYMNQLRQQNKVSTHLELLAE